jgi:hypothetical protein
MKVSNGTLPDGLIKALIIGERDIILNVSGRKAMIIRGIKDVFTEGLDAGNYGWSGFRYTRISIQEYYKLFI